MIVWTILPNFVPLFHQKAPMKRHTLLTLILILITSLAAIAQNISVKSFRALPMDMTSSSIEGKRIDQNGQVAALIKVVTNETGFVFEGGTLGIVDTKQQVSEIWVWLPKASRKITIKHPQLGQLRDYLFPVEIEAERTYEMVLTTANVETIIKEKVRQQFLSFQITPANATLEVDDQLWSVDAEGFATKYVDFGTYNYRVRASDYFTEAGKVTVDDPENTKTVIVNLKPNFAEITLNVDADVEIWVNNEKKGFRSWTGPLGNGTYLIECRQEGYETTRTTKEITIEMSGQTITLQAPKPIFGSLNVASSPGMATIFLDGKDMGKTPKSFNEVLVGQHNIQITKDGYTTHQETVVVKKGERAQVNASLKKESKPTTPTVNTTTVTPQTQPTKKVKNSFFVMANVAYAIAPQTSFGLTLGSVKRLGWYLSFYSNFRDISAPNSCNWEGIITGFTEEYSYSGNRSTERIGGSVGLVVKLWNPLDIYLGGGYGYRGVFWELNDVDNGRWVYNYDDSYMGYTLDAGLIIHGGPMVFSLGAQSIKTKYFEARIGLGVSF